MFWRFLLIATAGCVGYSYLSRAVRERRSAQFALHGFATVRASAIMRLEKEVWDHVHWGEQRIYPGTVKPQQSLDPDKLTFLFEYHPYTDWGGNSRRDGTVFVTLYREAPAEMDLAQYYSELYLDHDYKPSPQRAFFHQGKVAVLFDHPEGKERMAWRMVREMVNSAVIHEATLAAHFQKLKGMPRTPARKPAATPPEPPPATAARREKRPVAKTVALTRFQNQGGWVGYRDSAGRVVLEPHYSLGAAFDRGLALARYGDTLGAIDCAGHMHFELPGEDVEKVWPYRGKWAMFRSGRWVEIRQGPGGVERQDVFFGFYQFVDREGNLLGDGKAFQQAAEFHGGRAKVTLDDAEGYIDEDGNWLGQGAEHGSASTGA